MTWSDEVAAHEKKIRRQALIAGIVIGVTLIIVAILLLKGAIEVMQL